MTYRQEKWKLAVYGPARPRFSDGNTLWWREYANRSSASRAAASVRRMHPGSYGELTRYEITSDMPLPFWTCYGVRDRDVFEVWDDR